MSATFLEPETDKMVQFLGPETDIILQFLAPEKVKMGQQNFWSQKLTKWFSFWGQKPYFMGEWNFMSKAVSCKEKINGVDCAKDHSRLICGSGIIYCLSVRSEDNVDESVPSFPQMEDVRMENGVARLVYDNAV